MAVGAGGGEGELQAAGEIEELESRKRLAHCKHSVLSLVYLLMVLKGFSSSSCHALLCWCCHYGEMENAGVEE